MGMIDAIPRDWKKILASRYIPAYVINSNEEPHLTINKQPKNIKLIKARDIYFTIIKTDETTPNCIKAWNERLDLNLSIEDWHYIFTLPQQTVCDTKVIEIQYKILHRCYATDSIIAKWDNSKNAVCQKCNQKANILHNFVYCTETQKFWKEINQIFIDSGIGDIHNTLNDKDIILGKFIEAKYDVLNHAILYAKFFIHKRFINDQNLSVNAFLNFYKHTLSVEKQRYTKNNQLHEFNKRFGKVTI